MKIENEIELGILSCTHQRTTVAVSPAMTVVFSLDALLQLLRNLDLQSLRLRQCQSMKMLRPRPIPLLFMLVDQIQHSLRVRVDALLKR